MCEGTIHELRWWIENNKHDAQERLQQLNNIDKDISANEELERHELRIALRQNKKKGDNLEKNI